MLSFSQGKDYLDVSKVMTGIELSFLTDASFYQSNTLRSPSKYEWFVSPEYTFHASFNFEVSQTVFLSPVIGLSYAVRRTPSDEGVHTTTSGIEHVSYYMTSQTFNLNVGVQGEWHFRKRQRDSWSLKLSTMYSRIVYKEHGASTSVDGYPTFTARPKDLLAGNLSIGYTFLLDGVLDIQLFGGCSYRIGFRKISGPEHIAKVFPFSPMLGVAFVFDTSNKEQP